MGVDPSGSKLILLMSINVFEHSTLIVYTQLRHLNSFTLVF